MQSQRFGKDRRVRRHREFQQAFSGGVRNHGRFITLIVAPNKAGRPRLGIVASRKLGGAVARNRAKRLIREVFRQHVAPNGEGIDVVVIPRREFFDADFASLERDFRATYQRNTGRQARHAR